jgi:serine protease Do
MQEPEQEYVMGSQAVRMVVMIAFLLACASGAFPASATPQTESRNNTDTTRACFADGFAATVQRAVVAVVDVVSSRARPSGDDIIKQRQTSGGRMGRSVGSGVIVTPDGYILTSHHVIEGASDIKIFLSDNRQLDAHIVGSDPKTDVAVLKVDAVGLATIALGNSASVRAGDFVLAIGDPFGLRQTVTMGIVSATGRGGLGIEQYEDFIQTDAAIYQGSSGGPLINLRGELVGITTAGAAEYRGIGFAVPVDMARSVMDQVLLHGRVIRGWLGATVQAVTPATARIFGLTGDLRGALVADVEVDSPANSAGLLAGDIITVLNGKPVHDDRDLNLMISTMEPGREVHLKAYREGRTTELIASLIEEPIRSVKRAEHSTDPGFSPHLGLSVQAITTEISERLDLEPQTRGVIVTDVNQTGPAATAEVMEGDVIVEINRKPIRDLGEFHNAVRQSNTQQPLLLLVERSGSRMFLVVDPN